MLDACVAELAVADQARSRWLAHTAATRATADRASAELAARRAGRERPEPEVTAEEWLAEHDAATRTEDLDREIVDESDLADDRERAPEPAARAIESEIEDVRDVAAAEPPAADEEQVRVPSAGEMAETIRRAQRSLSEIAVREADEARALDEARAEQLARWHADEQAAEQEASTTYELEDDGSAIERGTLR